MAPILFFGSLLVMGALAASGGQSPENPAHSNGHASKHLTTFATVTTNNAGKTVTTTETTLVSAASGAPQPSCESADPTTCQVDHLSKVLSSIVSALPTQVPTKLPNDIRSNLDSGTHPGSETPVEPVITDINNAINLADTLVADLPKDTKNEPLWETTVSVILNLYGARQAVNDNVEAKVSQYHKQLKALQTQLQGSNASPSGEALSAGVSGPAKTHTTTEPSKTATDNGSTQTGGGKHHTASGGRTSQNNN